MTTMNPRIIYPTPDGGVAIIIPTGELPIEEVAKQVVPQGVPYAIVDASDIPEDRTFRAAWEWAPPEPVCELPTPTTEEASQ